MGSGQYSFHLVKGTVCFKCNGSGFAMVDLKAEATRKEKAAASKAEKEAYHVEMRRLYEETVKEMNTIYGPFDTDTLLGLDQLNKAVFQATGKTLVNLRDEKLK